MSEARVLQLHFLGARDYLQGTTLFDALAADLGAASSISLRVSRLIRSDHVAVERIDPDASDAGRYAARLVWNEGCARKALGVMELPRSPNPPRLPFDEAAILARARFDASAVCISGPGRESLVRTLVALNKALLQRLLSPPQPGQWLFVRLDLDRYAETFRELRIKHRTSVAFAAVSSAIEIDGQPAGTVVFSWLKK